MTNNKKQQPIKNRFGKTIINPPGGLASIKPANLNYVKHNPKGGIASIKQPNFVKRRRKAPDGHEIIEVDYT